MKIPRLAHDSIWRNTPFLHVTLINTLESLAIGIINTASILLVSHRFGSKDKLLLISILLLAPRLLLAPFIGKKLLKQGAVLIAKISIPMLALIFLAQTLITNYTLFQATTILQSLVGAWAIASLMTLQTWVIPQGKNIEANSIYLLTSRSTFFLAPFILHLGTTYLRLTIIQQFYLGIALLIIASLLMIVTSLPNTSKSLTNTNQPPTSSYSTLLHLAKQKKILPHLFIPLIGFFIINGGLEIFLLWMTQNTLQLPKASYITLLSAKGIANFLISLIAYPILHTITKHFTMETLYPILRLLTIILLASLTFATNINTTKALLILSTIPQTLASICFYTLLQKYLTKQEQSIVHTLTYPITQAFKLVAPSIAFLYTNPNSYVNLSLQHFWLLISIISLLTALASRTLLKQPSPHPAPKPS